MPVVKDCPVIVGTPAGIPPKFLAAAANAEPATRDMMVRRLAANGAQGDNLHNIAQLVIDNAEDPNGWPAEAAEELLENMRAAGYSTANVFQRNANGTIAKFQSKDGNFWDRRFLNTSFQHNPVLNVIKAVLEKHDAFQESVLIDLTNWESYAKRVQRWADAKNKRDVLNIIKARFESARMVATGERAPDEHDAIKQGLGEHLGMWTEDVARLLAPPVVLDKRKVADLGADEFFRIYGNGRFWAKDLLDDPKGRRATNRDGGKQYDVAEITTPEMERKFQEHKLAFFAYHMGMLARTEDNRHRYGITAYGADGLPNFTKWLAKMNMGAGDFEPLTWLGRENVENEAFAMEAANAVVLGSGGIATGGYRIEGDVAGDNLLMLDEARKAVVRGMPRGFINAWNDPLKTRNRIGFLRDSEMFFWSEDSRAAAERATRGELSEEDIKSEFRKRGAGSDVVSWGDGVCRHSPRRGVVRPRLYASGGNVSRRDADELNEAKSDVGGDARHSARRPADGRNVGARPDEVGRAKRIQAERRPESDGGKPAPADETPGGRDEIRTPSPLDGVDA